MEIQPMELTPILPVLPFNPQSNKRTLRRSGVDQAISSLLKTQFGPESQKFLFYICDFRVRPPRDLDNLSKKFAYCQTLHSYYSHHVTLADAKAWRIDPGSPAEDGHYLYAIALYMWGKRAPEREAPEPGSPCSNRFEFLRERHALELYRPGPKSPAWTATKRAPIDLGVAMGKEIKVSEEAAKENRGRATEEQFWKSVAACVRVTERQGEYLFGQRICRKASACCLPKLGENCVVRRIEGAVTEPGN